MHPTSSATRRMDKIVHYFDKIQVVQIVFLIADWWIFESLGRDYYNPYSCFLILYGIADTTARAIDKKHGTGGFYGSLLHLLALFPVIFGSIGLYIYYFWGR